MQLPGDLNQLTKILLLEGNFEIIYQFLIAENSISNRSRYRTGKASLYST